jgi:hypothetical protein
MSSEQKYLEALAKRAQEILQEETISKPSKPRAKKEMDAETKAKVLLNLQKGREKAAEVRNMKKQIQAKQKQEKIEEFESLKVKYGITSAKPIEKKPETPRRQRSDVPPYEPENIKETDKESREEIKEEVKVQNNPIDIPKPEVKVEKPIEIIQNSVPSIPTIQKPRYFKPIRCLLIILKVKFIN